MNLIMEGRRKTERLLGLGLVKLLIIKFFNEIYFPIKIPVLFFGKFVHSKGNFIGVNLLIFFFFWIAFF